MHYTLRARFRRLVDSLLEATRILPWLGFGKSAEPPTEPIQRSGSSFERPEAAREMTDQQHVDAGKRIEIDKSTE